MCVCVRDYHENLGICSIHQWTKQIHCVFWKKHFKKVSLGDVPVAVGETLSLLASSLHWIKLVFIHFYYWNPRRCFRLHVYSLKSQSRYIQEMFAGNLLLSFWRSWDFLWIFKINPLTVTSNLCLFSYWNLKHIQTELPPTKHSARRTTHHGFHGFHGFQSKHPNNSSQMLHV